MIDSCAIATADTNVFCWPHACSGIVRIDPFRFLARCRTRQLNRFCGGDSLRRGAMSSVCTFTFKPSSVCLSHSIVFIVLLLIRTSFCIFISLSWYAFCLLVVLVKLSVLAK